MSYYGRKKDAAADCAEADIQIDGNETSNTSPVLHGSNTAGMAPMSGSHEFTHQRTRPAWKTPVKTTRRSYPSEGVSGGS